VTATRRGGDVPLSLSAQIAGLELQLADLRRQQAGALLAAIAGAVPIDFAFSAHELFIHRQSAVGLADAFAEAGITNARRLGKTLERLQQVSDGGVRLDRLGADYLGVVWMLRDTLR